MAFQAGVVRSLGDIKRIIRRYGRRNGYSVRIKCLWGIRHAAKVRALLRQKIISKRWKVKGMGMAHLHALVRVHRRIAIVVPLLDKQLMEAGTGLPNQIPPPALVDIAGCVLHDEAHPEEEEAAEEEQALELPLATRLLDAGTGLRHLRVRSVAIESIIHQLGELIEDVAAAVMTGQLERHITMQYLLQAKVLLNEVWDLRVPTQEFSRM
uniref:Uncharacterized protein n=1 Tax=Leersia perrieri TaxID=77586 RepID=A0A0D9VFZ4_9ORYZ